MKLFALNIALLLSSTLASANPLAWSDLEPKMKVTLSSELKVLDFSFPAGTQFTIVDTNPLDGIDVVVVDARFSPCSTAVKAQTMDVEMIDADYGFELAKGCKASFYVETKDLYRQSYFQ